MRPLIRLGLCSVVALGACGEAGSGPAVDDFGYKGTGIAIGASPLTLDALSDACYSFTIRNELGELVVGRGPGAGNAVSGNAQKTLCASQFGNSDGGDIAYVAPCDASITGGDDFDGSGANDHSVRLWVDALCTGGTLDTLGVANWEATPTTPASICTEMQDYVNPCGTAGCELKVACVENADTPVTFNFTIMGQADQGFFDLAVNFEDIFCSAKLDTCYNVGEANETPINLLFDDTNNRAPTAVLALACTAGADAAAGTLLHLGNVTVDCGGTVETLDLSTITQEGNQTGVGALNWAAYFGSEALSGPSGPWNKEFFTVAITGFGSACSVAWTATASDGSLTGGAGGNVYSSHPVINYGPVPVTEASVTDGVYPWICSENPVNEPGSGVGTTYEPCTTPGDCLGGPCVTEQAGVFTLCVAGEPNACDPASDGITMTYTVAGGATDTTTLTFFLEPGTDPVGFPTYATTVLLGNGPTTFMFAENAGGIWQFSLAQEGSTDQQGENANLLGTWIIENDLTLNVTCGIEGGYLCASWENTNGDLPSTEYLDLLPTTVASGSTTVTGWGGTEIGGVYYQTAPTVDPTWQVSLPKHYEFTSAVPVGSVPTGVYTTVWNGTIGDGTDLYGPSVVVTITAGQCPEQVVVVDPPTTPFLFGSHTILTGGLIDRFDAGPVPASPTPLEDAAAPTTADVLPLNTAITHFDLAFDAVSQQLFGHDSVALSPLLGRAPLAVAVWDDVVANPGTTVSRIYRTHNGVDALLDWSVASGITNSVLEKYNVVVSNGSYVDPAGNRVLLAMQYGLRAGDTDRALHVFALQLVPDGTDPALGRIAVTHIEAFSFGTNASVTETDAQRWALIGPDIARNLTLERDGRVFLTGFGLNSATIVGNPNPTYIHQLQLGGGAGAYTVGVSSSFAVDGARYSIQGLIDANHLLMLRMDTPIVTYDVVKPGTGAVSETLASTLATPATAFFGTYEPSNGYIYGLYENTSSVSYHQFFDVATGSVVLGNIIAGVNVITPYKLNSLSFVHD